ncbi:hypothetical protein HDR69_03655 [bacterium]|nr:hypothetical protein [bacterium]
MKLFKLERSREREEAGGEGDFRLKEAPGKEASDMKLFKLEGEERGGGGDRRREEREISG